MSHLLETKSKILNGDHMLTALSKEGRIKLAAGPLGLSISVYVGLVDLLSSPSRKPSIPMITSLGDFTPSEEGFDFLYCFLYFWFCVEFTSCNHQLTHAISQQVFDLTVTLASEPGK